MRLQMGTDNRVWFRKTSDWFTQQYHYTTTHQNRVFSIKKESVISCKKPVRDDMGFIYGKHIAVLSNYQEKYDNKVKLLQSFVFNIKPGTMLVIGAPLLTMLAWAISLTLGYHAVAFISIFIIPAFIAFIFLLPEVVEDFIDDKRFEETWETKFTLPTTSMEPSGDKPQFMFDQLRGKIYTSAGLYNGDYHYYDIESLLSVKDAYNHLLNLYIKRENAFATLRTTHPNHPNVPSTREQKRELKEQIRFAQNAYLHAVEEANKNYRFRKKSLQNTVPGTDERNGGRHETILS